MPIYAYRCAQCGHAKDVLQKLSDAPLTVCPACSAEAFSRQVSAPAFQLKGSGWYVTDFRDNGKGARKGGASEDGAGGDAAAKPAVDAASGASADKPAAAEGAASAAPAPAPAPAAAPAAGGGAQPA